MTGQTNLRRARQDEGLIGILDIKVVEAMEPICDNPVVKGLGKASKLADQPPLIAASIITAVIGLVTRNPRLARTGLRMLIAHAIATGFKKVIKDKIDRPRPHKVEKDGRHEARPGKSKDGDEQSFPSGHSAGAMAVASAVVREYPAAAPVAYTAATLAAAIQVPRKTHFPSDVITGIVIGLFSEALFGAIARRFVPDTRQC